ncbi:MAG: formate dehydrogenase accessory sulfurtransferase FdhD [Cyclobacteriaceae bacterium]
MKMTTGLATPFVITKLQGEQRLEEADLVAVEEPLQIRLEFEKGDNFITKDLLVTMRSPGHDFDLAMGFLFAEQVIHREKDVLWIRYCQQVKEEEKGNVIIVRLAQDLDFDMNLLERNFYTHSSCGVCGKTAISAVSGHLDLVNNNLQQEIKAKTLMALPKFLSCNQYGFKYTGGLHAAVLFDAQGTLLALREDVGRHNALDKLVGASLKKGIDLENKVVLLSGRVSFEMVQKAVRAKIPVLAAFGAPTHLSVSLAREKGITMVGFLKKDRFNIYSHPSRIK